MIHKILLFNLLLMIIISGCGTKHSDKGKHKEDNHTYEENAHKDEVHLKQIQMKVMGIQLGKFQYLNLATSVKSNGQLEVPPQNKASLSVVMGGLVKKIFVLEGDFVRKGQTLATLEHPGYVDMQEEYMAAKNKLDFLEMEYLRKKELFAEGITSAKAYQKAEADYLSALSKVKGMKAKLRMLHINLAAVENLDFRSSIPVRSPIEGYVRHIKVNIGKYVQPQEEMFEIVDIDHIHIDLMVYEKDFSRVKNGQKVIFSLSNNSTKAFQGKIFAVGKTFEQEPKAMLVHAEIENKTTNLLPGMYVDARIVTAEEKVMALPNEAIVNDGGLTYIFVLKPSTTRHSHENEPMQDIKENHKDEYAFRKIEVKTGVRDIGFTEVVPAYKLPEHVQIVTKGAFYLLAELKKGEGGHGHQH